MPNIVVLSPGGQVKEALAGGTITPGHFLRRSSATQVVAGRAAAGGNGPKLIADINPELGRALDNNYASGEQVKMMSLWPGMEVRALVAASAAAIAVGDALQVAADGTVQKHTPIDQDVDEGGAATYTIAVESDGIVGYALEAVNNSGGGTVVPILMEVN